MADKVEFDCNEYLCGNKYHAKTETQYEFSRKVERELKLVCNFDYYSITRGRGWSKADGSCGSSVAIQSEENPNARLLLLYYPLRTYLRKKVILETIVEYSGWLGLFAKVKE